MGEHWDFYLCTDKDCGNQFEAKRRVQTCEVCGAPVTRRPDDNAIYDFDRQAWNIPADEDDE